MSDKKRQRVELRVVEAGLPPKRPGPPGGDGGMGDVPGSDRPVVRIITGKRSEAIDKAEQYLVMRDPHLFSRGDCVVRVAPEDIDIGAGRLAPALRIVIVGVQHMREQFTRAVDLRRFDKRADEWISSDCPRDFAEAYLERFGHWRLPKLRGVVTTPTLRPDGSVIERPGYDQATQIYYDPRGIVFPPVPAAPDRAAALAALDRLKCVLGTFDFVDDASRSVALSGILTCLLRRMMSAAPLHGFSAPVAGSGKSKLVNIAAILATGHPAAVMSLGDNPGEAEKRLGAAALAGDGVIAIDNTERAVGGEFLCQLLTEPLTNVRILGTSINSKVPNVFSVFATGNNLKVFGDMTRRALICRLDPHCERPELREFETPDPLVIVLRERVNLVISALTILRAFFLAGSPSEEPALGSFAEWSHWVRDPLIWLGEADPAATIETARGDDPRLATLAAVLHQWHSVIGGVRVSVRELIGRADTENYGVWLYPDLRQSLLAVAGRGDKFNQFQLGRWLGQVVGRAVGGLMIERDGIIDGIQRWCVRKSSA